MSRRARGIHTRVLVKFNTRGGERREGRGELDGRIKRSKTSMYAGEIRGGSDAETDWKRKRLPAPWHLSSVSYPFYIYIVHIYIYIYLSDCSFMTPALFAVRS